MEHFLQSDICIIGGGIAGLYCAHKLAQRNPSRKITVFEGLSRLGGRVQTGSFCNGTFHPEFGALRIEPELQPCVNELISELKIPTTTANQHNPTISMHPDFEKLHLEEQLLIKANPNQGAPLILLEHALKKILGNQWDIEGDHWDLPNRDEKKQFLRSTAIFNGVLLYHQGAWNVFSEVLSYEAIEFVREKGAFYNLKNANPNAADWISILLDMRLIKQPSYSPVGGMDTLIHSLEKAITEKQVNILCNHELTCMKSNGDSSTQLIFSKKDDKTTVTVDAKTVILAIPQAALLKLADSLPSHIVPLLSKVRPLPMVWAYCIVENPHWTKSTPTGNGKNMPVRAVHLELDGQNPPRFGMAMFYCDEPWSEYWADLVEEDTSDSNGTHFEAQINRGSRLMNALSKALQSFLSLKDPPKIVEWAIRDWGRQPFGGGVHLWKPRAKSADVMNELKAFSLNGSTVLKNIHICNEAFSDLQGFFEGSLRSANNALQTIECEEG